MKKLNLALFCLLAVSQFIYAQNWIQQSSGTTQILESIFMLNESEGWIVGDAGTLLRTSNGGASWTQVSVTGEDLQDIEFRGSQLGLIAGDDGLILRTINGGINWTTVPSGTSANLAAVSWASDNIVFISGRDGAALISTNAGASWTNLNTGSSARYRGAYAFSNKLWAVGEDGIIIHSANNGASWQTQANPATNDLHDIQFLTDNTGFAGGSSSTILYTSNGGLLWSSRSTGINFGINGIYFLNENTGWAASDGGVIYYTSNTGINWTAQSTGFGGKINEVHFPSAAKGWAVGENGTIFFLDTGVPVELMSFTATAQGSGISLSWATATETNNAGFEIERKKDLTGIWVNAGFVKGSGNATSVTSYNFTDLNLLDGIYNYRLKQVNFDGTSEMYYLKNEIAILSKKEFSLNQNYPNPFNPSTIINFNLPSDGNVTLKIFNILGKEVAVLLDEYKEAGDYNLQFNASELPAGVYLYQLQADGITQVRKMTLLK